MLRRGDGKGKGKGGAAPAAPGLREGPGGGEGARPSVREESGGKEGKWRCRGPRGAPPRPLTPAVEAGRVVVVERRELAAEHGAGAAADGRAQPLAPPDGKEHPLAPLSACPLASARRAAASAANQRAEGGCRERKRPFIQLY